MVQSPLGAPLLRRRFKRLLLTMLFPLALWSQDVSGAPPGETAVKDALPEGWPWAMLRTNDAPILASDLDVPAELLEKHAVVSVHVYQAQQPTMLLFVYEFARQKDALAAIEALVTWGEAQGKPYYGNAVVNGAYLLIAGFPSEKPVSPEMEEALMKVVQSFAGEE